MKKLIDTRAPKNPAPWPDPTPKMLASPQFEAIWQRIKTWDINVPEVDGEGVYTGATGNHVRAILDALLMGGECGGPYYPGAEGIGSELPQPNPDCKVCSGARVIASQDYPGKTIPCPACFPHPNYIGKLLDQRIRK